ncbi:MAG TPA: hypothetical protein VN207_08015, partial [Ktedonobacteraceae bacterium]|nr:hypothetical protein [Ktedonobacteraceae bacterium]
VEQRPRAEDDIAVAAAAAFIIVRATFIHQIEELSQGIGVELPKGASSPMIVTVGREIVARTGRDALGKVAKLRFKTTQEILQRYYSFTECAASRGGRKWQDRFQPEGLLQRMCCPSHCF